MRRSLHRLGTFRSYLVPVGVGKARLLAGICIYRVQIVCEFFLSVAGRHGIQTACPSRQIAALSRKEAAPADSPRTFYWSDFNRESTCEVIRSRRTPARLKPSRSSFVSVECCPFRGILVVFQSLFIAGVLLRMDPYVFSAFRANEQISSCSRLNHPRKHKFLSERIAIVLEGLRNSLSRKSAKLFVQPRTIPRGLILRGVRALA